MLSSFARENTARFQLLGQVKFKVKMLSGKWARNSLNIYDIIGWSSSDSHEIGVHNKCTYPHGSASAGWQWSGLSTTQQKRHHSV
jgi:hypothetical protein